MNWGIEPPRWLAAVLPRSVVARTSLSILLLAVIMGLVSSIMASWRVQSAEHDRLLARVFPPPSSNTGEVH